MREATNILIFHAGALGDFVLTWPLAMALSHLYPESRIVYVTHAAKGQLAQRFLPVEFSCIDTGGWYSMHGDWLKLSDANRALLAGAERVFAFVSRPDEWFSRNCRRLGNMDVTELRALPVGGAHRHVAAFYVEQLRTQPELARTLAKVLRSLQLQGLAANRPAATRVLVHPGSGSRSKCWPADRFVELISALRADGHDVGIVIGEVELDRWPREQVEAFSRVLMPATPCELAEELLNCRLLITNDNGPGHLAAMLGTPTLCLFGPTDPAIWRPLGPSVTVLHPSTLDALPMEEVLDAARQCITEVPVA